MGLRSARGMGSNSLKVIGLLLAAVGTIIVYATLTSIGQLGEMYWLFTLIGALLICVGLPLVLARAT